MLRRPQLGCVLALGLVAVASPSSALASHGARVYIADSCGSEAVKPLWIPLDCPGADPPSVAAEPVVYRTYGGPTAVASAIFRVCGGVCYSGATRAQEMLHYYKGTFRFSRIERCYGKKGFARGSRLFYAVTAYRFGGRPWTTYSTNSAPPESYRCPHASALAD